MPLPVIPEYITVHLGKPSEAAENIRVPFIDYIKNVASSEIYPTWPENAIRANILAQISFALNRIYTEWYPSRGYNFDVTNSTQFDQAYVKDRDIFDNINRIVDDVFNDYVRRQGSVEPLFTQYCDGVRVQCNGLSQWGSVTLANQGLGPYEILQRYYGNDIDIVFNAPTGENLPSYPGIPLKRGSAGEDVRTLQRELNRIRRNFPSIPQIAQADGIFSQDTEAAVKEFQRIFDLAADGIVGKGTWYKIKSIYTSVKRLSELVSEGLTFPEVERKYPKVLKFGDSGTFVKFAQYFLSFLGFFDPDLPQIAVDGQFGEETQNAVFAFQKKYGLAQDGIIGRDTWNRMMEAYNATYNGLPPAYRAIKDFLYPGYMINIGSSGAAVKRLQEALNEIAERDPLVPTVEVDGIFGPQTENAVKIIQRQYGYPPNGSVGPLTWSRIISESYQI